MSRSGYSEGGDDCDGWSDSWASIRWRGAVASAIRGKRGQKTLQELAAALDAMPHKALAAESLVTVDGEFCALGVLGAARGLDMSGIDTDNHDTVSRAFGIARAMAAEIMDANDTGVDEFDLVPFLICGPMRPYHPDWGDHQRWESVSVSPVAERRWQYMRAWVERNLTAGKVQP